MSELDSYVKRVKIAGDESDFNNPPDFEGQDGWTSQQLTIDLQIGKNIRDSMAARGISGIPDQNFNFRRISTPEGLNSMAYSVSEFEIVGLNKTSFQGHLAESQKAKQNEAENEALIFFRQALIATQGYNDTYNVPNNDARRNRLIISNMPFFKHWTIEYPSLDVDFYRQIDTAVVDAHNPIFELNLLKFANFQLQPAPGQSHDLKLKTDLALIRNIESLEGQYLEYLYTLKAYLETYAAAWEVFVSGYAGAFSNLSQIPGTGEHGPGIYDNAPNWVLDFIQRAGIINVTPDVLDNLCSLRMLVQEGKQGNHNLHQLISPSPATLPSAAFSYLVDGVLQGLDPTQNLHYGKTISAQDQLKLQDDNIAVFDGLQHFPTLFKLSPYDIEKTQEPSDSIRAHGAIAPFLKIERNFMSQNALTPGDRVCVFGIESGQLDKILSANQTFSTAENDLTNFSVSSRSNYKIKVEFEMVDYFRPWLVFEHIPRLALTDMIYPRSKAYRFYNLAWWTAQMESISHESINHRTVMSKLSSWIIDPDRKTDGILKNWNNTEDPNHPDGLAQTPEASNIKFSLNTFLKTYISKVIGLDFYSYLIPKKYNHQMLSSVTNDDLFSDERNYREELRTHTKGIVDYLRAHQDSSTGQARHILKYFFDRTYVPAISNDETGRLEYREFDSYGRSKVVDVSGNDFSLFSKDAFINNEDGDKSWFHPFRFNQPIDKGSLRASEVLTSINEAKSNFEEIMSDFHDGFAFDMILAIPYSLNEFKLKTALRSKLDGIGTNLHLVDDPRISQYANKNPNASDLIDFSNSNIKLDNFYDFAQELGYLEQVTVDGVLRYQVKRENNWPLALRVKVKRVYEQS